MKSFSIILLSFLVFWIAGCSKAPEERGDEALANGRYAEAVKAYLEAMQTAPDSDALKEKIATAYFRQGEKIYSLRKVIPAFEMRVEKGTEYLPINLSDEMRHTVAEVNLKMAKAYLDARPENQIQKKEFFDKILYYLEETLAYDPANDRAGQMLSEFQKEHFQEMLTKGKSAYDKGKRDPVSYITADYYLTNAIKFDPESKEAAKYLKLARQKALNVLDPTQSLPLAVTDQVKKEGFLALMVVVQNPDMPDQNISAGDFVLLTKDGQETAGVSSELFAESISEVTLKQGGEISGVVAFPLKKNADYQRLELRGEGKVLGYKNLP